MSRTTRSWDGHSAVEINTAVTAATVVGGCHGS